MVPNKTKNLIADLNSSVYSINLYLNVFLFYKNSTVSPDLGPLKAKQYFK